MGLFKKKKYADIIFYGGKIYTMDENYPEAEAVAVCGGKIIAVGDFELIKDDLQDNHTIMHNLDGKFMTPGLIDIHADCTPDYLRELSRKTIKKMEEEAESLNQDAESEVLEDTEDENSSFEQELENEALGENEINMDYMFAVSEVNSTERAFIKRGVTSFLNLECSAYGDDNYKNLLMQRWQNGTLKQRYFGSQFLNRMVDPSVLFYVMETKRTACNELEGFINFKHADIVFSSDSESENYMNEDYLRIICEFFGDHGFSIRFNANDEGAFELAQKLAEDYSSTYKKQCFVAQMIGAEVPAFDIEDMTLYSAKFLGASKQLGSIEEGKLADFAVFDSDPYSGPSNAYTVLGGKILR